MKISIKVLALALALTSSVAFAAPDSSEKKVKKNTFETGMYTSASNMLVVNIEKTHTKPVKVVIKNKDGDVINKGFYGSGHKSYAVKFNVNSLEAGTYTLQVTDNGFEKTRKFEINENVTETPRTVTVSQ